MIIGILAGELRRSWRTKGPTRSIEREAIEVSTTGIIGFRDLGGTGRLLNPLTLGGAPFSTKETQEPRLAESPNHLWSFPRIN